MRNIGLLLPRVTLKWLDEKSDLHIFRDFYWNKLNFQLLSQNRGFVMQTVTSKYTLSYRTVHGTNYSLSAKSQKKKRFYLAFASPSLKKGGFLKSIFVRLK